MLSRLLLVAFVLISAPARAGVKEKVAALAPQGLVYVIDANGAELVAQNAEQPFVPASVAKLVTAWMALDTLGPDYRFQTSFYLDDKRTLYVRGGGDPFLISEELEALAKNLVAATGPTPLAGVVLDASYYPADLRIPGIENTAESYDALNSALAVNFNTIHAVQRGSAIVSGEKQTPITPLAIDQFRKRGPKGRNRISLAQDPALSQQYAGELLVAFIQKAGGSVKGAITTGPVPQGLAPIYVHRQSRPLSEVIHLLLVGSNNYVANQVFLEIGARRSGAPVSLDKSIKAANDLLAAHDLAQSIHLEEGSGISRGNHFTARGLAKVLTLLAPHAGLLRKSKGAAFKTGTFDGVRTLAGYLDTAGHGKVRFVIALKGNNTALRFKLMQAIQSAL